MKPETKEEKAAGEEALRAPRRPRRKIPFTCARCGVDIGPIDELYGDTHCRECTERFGFDKPPRRRRR